jgi:hypothetical protein
MMNDIDIEKAKDEYVARGTDIAAQARDGEFKSSKDELVHDKLTAAAKHIGKSVKLFRGMKNLPKLNTKGMHVLKALTSTSTKKSVADKYATDGKDEGQDSHVLSIDAKPTTKVVHIGRKDGEFVLPPGTKLKFKSAPKTVDGVHHWDVDVVEQASAIINESLVISSKMKGKAKRDGAVKPVMLNARTFLHVTTHDDTHLDEIKGAAKSLHDYNASAADRESYPYLRVKLNKDGSAKVIGHDGRHRASAAINAGHSHIPVHFIMHDVDYEPIKNFDSDLPTKIAGQHRGQIDVLKDVEK